jgi:hypothetical protein
VLHYLAHVSQGFLRTSFAASAVRYSMFTTSSIFHRCNVRGIEPPYSPSSWFPKVVGFEPTVSGTDWAVSTPLQNHVTAEDGAFEAQPVSRSICFRGSPGTPVRFIFRGQRWSSSGCCDLIVGIDEYPKTLLAVLVTSCP